MKSKFTFLSVSNPFRRTLFILIPVMAFSFNLTRAQCWQWATGLGGATMETPTSLAVDPYGHMAITGEFMGTAVFDTHTLVATSGRDVFTVLLDSTGTVLNAMGGLGDGPENIGTGVAFDANGNCFITGNFTGTIVFDDVTLESAGSGDIFIVKYNASGNLLWANQAGGTSEILVNDIAVDSKGNCLITGDFYDSAIFGDKTAYSTYAQDVFIVKYDPDGYALWAASCGSTSSDLGTGIAVDNTGNVYIAGYFQSEFIFGGIAYGTEGNRDVFVAKMDKDATPLWATVGGGSYNDFFGKIAVDTAGNNVYVTGEFESYTADIDGIILTNMNQSVSRRDIMLLNFDSQGSARWGLSTGSAEHDYLNDVTLDDNGDVYITGIYKDAITFGTTTLTNNDFYIAKYDSTGNSLWAKGSTYNTALAASNSIATFKNRPVIAGDLVAGTGPPIAVFDNDTIISNGSLDVFLARVGPPCNEADPTGIDLLNETDAGFEVYPNPFSQELNIHSIVKTRSLDVGIYNTQGQLVLFNQVHNVESFTIDTGHLPAGIYFVNVKSGDAVQSIKMVKVGK
jgi:hypothetical protein